MKDQPWKRDEIDSPCVAVCMIHPDAGICIGCLRSAAEIERWSDMTPDQRAAIRAELAARAPRLRNRRRARSRRGA